MQQQVNQKSIVNGIMGASQCKTFPHIVSGFALKQPTVDWTILMRTNVWINKCEAVIQHQLIADNKTLHLCYNTCVWTSSKIVYKFIY